MANPLEHKNFKYIFDRASYSYHRTLYKANDTWDSGGAVIKIFATGTLASAALLGTIGYNHDVNMPAEYEHDSGEIEQEYKAFLDKGIDEIDALSQEIQSLERQALINGYEDPKASEVLLAEAAEKAKEAREKLEYIGGSMFVSSDMSETAFAEYAQIMRDKGYADGPYEFTENVDPNGLKECQLKNTSADYIQDCMKETSRSEGSYRAANTAIASTIGAGGGFFLTLLLAATGALGYSRERAKNKPVYSNYRKGPGLGDN